MAELRVRTIDESEIDTLLAPDFEFDGEVFFDQPLLIKGRLSGRVRSESDVFVADTAYLHAEIEAQRVSVKGRITGNVAAAHRVELFSTAAVTGNVNCPELIVQSGARLNGTCVMPDANPDVVEGAS